MRSTFAAATMLSALSVLNASAFAQADEDRVLKPKINGIELEISCKRDFPSGEPTVAFLERLDTQVFHRGRPGTVSFLMADEEERNSFLKKANGFARVSFQAMARAYNTAEDKTGFVKKILKNQHRFDAGFYVQVAAKCENG